MEQITTAAAWLALLAIVALIGAGWRQPARAATISLRVRRNGPPRRVVTEAPTPLYRPPRWWRRAWSLVATAGLGVITGVVVATVVGIAAVLVVIRVTDLLKQ